MGGLQSMCAMLKPSNPSVWIVTTLHKSFMRMSIYDARSGALELKVWS